MTARKAKPHTKATRPRGAATTLCPCGKLSRVLRTTRSQSTGNVVRHRECAKGHRFTTEEIPQ